MFAIPFTSLILWWKSFDLWFFTKNHSQFQLKFLVLQVRYFFMTRMFFAVHSIEKLNHYFLLLGTTVAPKTQKVQPKIDEQDIANVKESAPAPIRITLASIDEFNYLLQNGLDFYGATFFPTEANLPATAHRIATKKGA